MAAIAKKTKTNQQIKGINIPRAQMLFSLNMWHIKRRLPVSTGSPFTVVVARSFAHTNTTQLCDETLALANIWPEDRNKHVLTAL